MKKKIVGLLIFIFLVMLSKNVFGIVIDVGETYTINASDIKVGSDKHGTSIESVEIDDTSVAKYEFNEHKTSCVITALKEGTVNVTVEVSTNVTVSGVWTTIQRAYGYGTYTIQVEKSLMQKIEEAQNQAEPGEDIETNYMDVAYWVTADYMYNNSKKLIELAKTDDGINKLDKWRDEFDNHTRVGEKVGEKIQSDSSKEKITELNILYTAKEVLVELVQAQKDEDKLNDIANKYGDIGKNILAIYPTVAEEVRKTVFNNDVLEDVDAYDPSKHELDATSTSKIENITSNVLTVISNIGIAVSVIMLAALGIKYMLGSVEEKAEYKEGLIPYVVGAFILFGITGFIKILIAIGDKIGNI